VTPNTAPTFAVVLAAGGRGVRFGQLKQFVELNGIPIYVWSLSTLLSNGAITRGVIAAPADVVETIETQLRQYSSLLFGKPVDVVTGGDTRQKSVYLGLQHLKINQPDFAIVHDAARPFLTKDLVDRFVEAVIKYGACTAAIPCPDTVKKVEGEHVAETISREGIALIQTPQGGRFDWLLAAHERCDREGIVTTDDASVLEQDGHGVAIVRGASSNIKITEPEDMVLANALAAIVLADRL